MYHHVSTYICTYYYQNLNNEFENNFGFDRNDRKCFKTTGRWECIHKITVNSSINMYFETFIFISYVLYQYRAVAGDKNVWTHKYFLFSNYSKKIYVKNIDYDMHVRNIELCQYISIYILKCLSPNSTVLIAQKFRTIFSKKLFCWK